MEEALDQSSTPPSAQANISAVVRLEEEAQQQRSCPIGFLIPSPISLEVSRSSCFIFAGSGSGFSSTRQRCLRRCVDPYPFALLCMLVSLEGVLLSTFVLIKQNRMSSRADERSHLDLQINLLSEKELTKILQLQKLICSKLKIEEAEMDFEVKELSNVTAVDNIAHELSRRLPRTRNHPR